MSDDQSFAKLASEARVRRPEVALVLGSGLSELTTRSDVICRVPFAEIPGMQATSVDGHKGCLALGQWGERRVLLFEGRLHFYEGHPWTTVVAPVQIAYSLGARMLVQTNAAGGIHDALLPGSLMVIRDHIEWTRPYCWRRSGTAVPEPDRPTPYTRRLIGILQDAARGRCLECQTGVYAAVTGPCYETPAEIRALRAWGADAVGMSTAREAQQAFDLGMECAAVSLITNRAAGLSSGPINHEEVLAMGKAGGMKLAELLEGLLRGVTAD